MHLPLFLEQAIEEELKNSSQKDNARASEELSRLYQNPNPHIRLTGDSIHNAYLAVRMPATFAVVTRVLEELMRHSSIFLTSLLDIGSGPGTALWAAVETCPELKSAYLLEQNSSFISIAKRIAQKLTKEINCHWQQGSIPEKFPDGQFDLVTASYVIGELSEEHLISLLEKAWKATGQALVFIEPGTPRGFERILLARDWLIQSGAHIAAPCPHEKQCPLAGTERWCHFSERLSRSALHKNIKGASLGYEDEKYSYLIATKSSQDSSDARLVGHPRKHSGHLTVDVCLPEGDVKQRTISRRDGPLYKAAQKASWGDTLPLN